MSRTIQISDETFEKLKGQLDESVEVENYDDLVGGKWFFRTVTYHATGRVTKRIGDFLQLEDAAWIADSGRFMQAIREGVLNEVEPVGTMFINLKTVVDFFPWTHKLPTEQK